MFSTKFCQILLIFTLAFCSSCRFWQTPSNSNISNTQANVAEIKSEIPFATKEPDSFQAELIIKSEDEAETQFFARSNGRTLIKTGQIGNLKLEPSKSFLIDFEKKIYVENAVANTGKIVVSDETLQDFLTTEWLNQKTVANYENLGEENGLTKYRIGFENSESFIFIDENYKIPVRQEFFSIEGEQKTLVYSMELTNIKLQVDENLFAVPTDFRKVSADEFKQNSEKK